MEGDFKGMASSRWVEVDMLHLLQKRMGFLARLLLSVVLLRLATTASFKVFSRIRKWQKHYRHFDVHMHQCL